MSLGEATRRISRRKVAPEGLKPQECKRNSGGSKALIPHIPKKDEIKEAVDSSAPMLKLIATQGGVACPYLVKRDS